jgi:hypothetical protein
MPTKKSSQCVKRKMSKVMHEWKTGKLRSSHGVKVKNHKQAVAIGLSMARKSCGKKSVPARKKTMKKSTRKGKSVKKH